MRILNLTQHAPTQAQIEAGVFDAPEELRGKIIAELNFAEIPHKGEIHSRADEIARLAVLTGCEGAMIGGAPYLMAPLERSLANVGIASLYSFSERQVVEVSNPDGTVSKTTTFAHVGWVEV